MTRFLALVATLILALPFTSLLARDARAEQVVNIASGRKGGTYRSVYARNLEGLMRGYKLVYLPSEGSGENLDLLASGEADIAFAQADVYAAKLAADPKRFGEIMLIGRLAPECVYIAYRTDGPVKSLADLAARAATTPTRIAVGAESSGMSGTWSYLRTLVPGLEQVEVNYTVGTLALNQLAAGSLDATGWVTDPNNPDQKLTRALKANADLALMDLDDPALLTPLADGTKVYEAKTVNVGTGVLPQKTKTVCTSAMLFVRKDSAPELIDKLSDVVSLRLKDLVPQK